MKVKEESEKVSLKLNFQKTKITASGPITSWEIDGETVETLQLGLTNCLITSCGQWLLYFADFLNFIEKKKSNQFLYLENDEYENI